VRGFWLAASGLGGRTALWLLLLMVGIAAADRSRIAIDLSADRRFTISPELTKLVDAQRSPVDLVGIWEAKDDDALQPIARALTLIAQRNPLVTWRRIDPALDKPVLEDFASRHRGARGDGLYVCRGERTRLIALNPLTRLVMQREIGGALIALNDEHPPRAALMQGHGELRPGGGANDGCDELAHALELAGWTVALHDGSSPLPADALAVLAGPTAALGESALTALAQHMRDGGALLVLADDRAPADLCAFLRQRGLLLGSGYPTGIADGQWSQLLDAAPPTLPAAVVHSMHHYFTGQEAGFPNHRLLLGDLPGAPMIEQGHPATQAVAASGVFVLSPRTGEIERFTPERLADKDAEVAKRFAASGLAPRTTTMLLSTAPGDAWTQPFAPTLRAPQGLEQADARALAWALEYAPSERSVREGMGARIIAWGSREAASDGVLAQAGFANADLLRGMASWLSGRSAPTDIPRTDLRIYQAALSDGALWLLLGMLVGVVPCVLLGGAMLTWWDRR
jgi:hypothetical protein